MTDKYEMIEWEGQPARKYQDGTIRHHEKGYILHFPPEKGRAMELQRKALGQEAARRAIQNATRAESAEEGWSKIMEAKVDVAMNDKGRAGNDAARLLGLASGFMQPLRRVEIDGQVNHVPQLPELTPEVRELLEKLIEDRRDNPQVIEGKALDIEGDFYEE